MGEGNSTAILLGVWATFALDVFSTFTSSPQTTEINAKSRADTLMKWVFIATLVAVTGGVLGSLSASNHKWLPILVTAGVALGMFSLYAHAKQKGLESPEAETEF